MLHNKILTQGVAKLYVKLREKLKNPDKIYVHIRNQGLNFTIYSKIQAVSFQEKERIFLPNLTPIKILLPNF